MNIDKQEENILLDLFRCCHDQKKWVDSERFIADHAESIDVIRRMVNRNLIIESTRNGTYHVSFGVFDLIDNSLFNKMMSDMQTIFYALKNHYIKNLQATYSVTDIAMDLDLEHDHLIECVLYLKEIVSINGSTDWFSPDADFTVSQSILDFKDFDDVIDRQTQFWAAHQEKRSEPKTMRSDQIDKMICQAVAKTLWDVYPEMNIADMCKHRAIQNYAGGKNYVSKTLRRWFQEIDLRDPKKKIGRPRKNNKLNQ